MNKKGFMGDVFPIVALLFGIALLFITSLTFFSGLESGLNGTITDFPIAEHIVETTNNDIDWTLDFLFMMALIAFPVGSMILAYINNVPPFFFFASMGVVLLVVIFGAAFSSAWDDSNDNDGFFSVQSARMPMTNFVMSHFGVYALFCSIIIASGTYIKLKNNAYGY